MDSKGKVSFGFKKAVPGIGGKAAGAGEASSSSVKGRNMSLFGEDDGEEEERGQGGKVASSSRLGGVAGAAPQSRSAKQRTEEALGVDASVFDYDGVYDSMKVGEREAAARREEEKKRRDPKYISAALATSEQRKIDRTRAEAKMIQRERDNEGDEFKDSEAFVTDAYKKQMEEMREAEEKDKKKEEMDRSKSKGVAGFFKSFMEENDRTHQAAVKASLDPKRTAAAAAAATVAMAGEGGEKDKVADARNKGLDVRLNDDNEIVDERSLLSAGLNTFGKKKARVEEGEERWERADRGESGRRDGAREAREAREAQRQRQSRMIEAQMLELEKKKEEDAREEEVERKRALVAQRRNDESSVASAKERALERKRKREEEQRTKGA